MRGRIFFKTDVQYPKEMHEIHYELQLLPERRKIEKKMKNCLLLIYMIKLNMLFT